MGNSVGPRQAMSGSMLPRGFVMGGMRQGTVIDPRDYATREEYRRAVEEEDAKEKRFFDGIGQWQQSSKPFWMR